MEGGNTEKSGRGGEEWGGLGPSFNFVNGSVRDFRGLTFQ